MTSGHDVDSPWLLWQLVDSAFPVGSFAHSSGLEAAWHCGEVSGADDVRRFAHQAIVQAGWGALPLLTAAHAAPARLASLDALADAFLTNIVTNRASRVQGRALASTCARIWPVPAVIDIDSSARTLCGHLAPVAGAVTRAMGVPGDTSRRLFLFHTARGIAAAAVRLGIIGSYEAQRLQFECGPVLDAVLERSHGLDDRHVTQTAPIVDIMQAAHDRLYSRLFQS